MYKYRLLGLSEEWSTTSERKLYYPGLNPGTYRLEMLVRNSSGVWSEEAQWLEFEIEPHLFQTGWFRYGASTTSAVILAGIIFGYVRSRQRKLSNENILLTSSLNALKLEMNPHFIFNALNSIQYFIANNQKREANLFLARFATLVRNVLNATAQAKLKLSDEIAKLTDYLELERLRLHHHFRYKVQVGDFDPEKVFIPTMLIQPIIENAIWHGVADLDKTGTIHLNFDLYNDLLVVSVQDNGRGMSEDYTRHSDDHKSRGLHNIQSRLDLMSQIGSKEYSMNIETGPDGTLVIIKIPQ